MADTEMSPSTLLGELAALDPSQRREVAKALRKVAETFAGVPDGRNTTHFGCWPLYIGPTIDRTAPAIKKLIRWT